MMAFHFVDSFRNMSLSEEDTDVEFKLFERFCVWKTCLSTNVIMYYVNIQITQPSVWFKGYEFVVKYDEIIS